MSQPLTKEDLKKGLFEMRDGIREDIKAATREVIMHFKRMDQKELQRNGIAIDRQRVFAQ